MNPSHRVPPVAPVPLYASVPPAAAENVATQNASSTAQLLGMSRDELRAEVSKRGIRIQKSANKTKMWQALGLPIASWERFCKMKIAELKIELKKRNLAQSGNKQQLLERLGVPKEYHKIGPRLPTIRQILAAKNKPKKSSTAATSSALSSLSGGGTSTSSSSLGVQLAMLFVMHQHLHENATNLDEWEANSKDPSHNSYRVECCANPRVDMTGEPVAAVVFECGSLTEIWKCTKCGGQDRYPNARMI